MGDRRTDDRMAEPKPDNGVRLTEQQQLGCQQLGTVLHAGAGGENLLEVLVDGRVVVDDE